MNILWYNPQRDLNHHNVGEGVSIGGGDHTGTFFQRGTHSYDSFEMIWYVNNTRVTDDVIKFDNTEYSSHEIAEVVDGEKSNDWILVTRSRIVK